MVTRANLVVRPELLLLRSRCTAKDFILALPTHPHRGGLLTPGPATNPSPERNVPKIFSHCPLTESMNSCIMHANDPSRQRLLA